MNDNEKELNWFERNKEKLIAAGITVSAVLLLAVIVKYKIRVENLNDAGIKLFTKYCDEHARAELLKEMLNAAKDGKTFEF